MRFTVALLLALSIPLKALFSQQSSTKISVQVNWLLETLPNSGMAINSFPLFDGMFYLNNDPIPHLFYKIPTPFEYRPDAISVFFDQTKVTIDDHISNTFISASTLKDDFSGNAYISTENGRQYLCITMIPFRKGPTGIEKLLSADLTLVTSGSVISRKKSNGNNRSANSVLADGLWKKIKISKTGIYRLTYDNLISMGFLNPSKVTLWGSQSTMLAKTPSSDYPVDLQQIPTSFLLGSDNQFNSGDMAVFFLQDAVDWKYNSTNRFNHQIHDYSDFAYYFITDSKPSTATIVTATKITNANTFSTSYDDYTYIEREDTNLIKSGRGWFGESFDILDSRNYSFPIPDLITTAPIWARMRTAARSSSSSSFTLSYAGNPVLTTTHSGVSYDETSAAANISEKSATFSASNSPLNINITYSRPSPSAAGWLDFLELNFRRNLNLSTPYVLFRDQTVVGDGKITEFSISSGIAESQLWEISSLWDVKRVETSLSNGILKGVVNTSIMKEYIAFNSSRLESPTVVGSVENQNLTGATPANLVIVSAPNYITQAQRISNLHKSADGLTTLVVTSQEVFNEFSGGKPDAAAIRNFLKFLTEKATSPETTPRYLLLFGDGSYKNRNLSPESPFMITYQSDNSLEVLNSYVSDDFFGLLDIGEVPGTGLMDIGVGRLPASNAEEAKVMVDKIESYMNPTSSMDWVNKLTFIGDDEDGNIHMRDANTIATYVETTYPNYIVDKIYFDSYAQISSPSGARYPDVTDAINKKVNKGALIVNYTGHGNEQYLAHERVVSIADIMSWTNKNKLALFITATCEFSRYDDYNRTSAGEYILLNPNGGGVALLSTTRLVYSNPNFTLNDNFFHKVFEKGMDGEYPRLGDLVRDAKNNTGPDFNKLNFSLLGDPALKLNNSTIQINAEKLNGKSLTTAFVDTLKALSKVTIEGSVNTTRASGEGNVNILFYDKEKEVTTLNNDNGTPFIYKTRSSILYQGNATIKNGTFKSEFIVPKDIAYNIGKGKLYLQATTGQSVGLANFSDFLVGGINTNAPTDISPPSVELFLNDENFVDGGITPEQPKLIAIIEDSSGINTTGNGIGHDIIAEITGTTSTKIVLNDYYKANQDSYTAGKIEYPLEKLQPGEYSLSLKVWDTYNNSGSKKLSFRVVKEENFTIEHLLNYPNPFTENTAFYFEHNRPNNNLDVLIQVFTLSGKLVKTIEYSSLPPTSLRIGPIFWDGKDDFGDNIGRGTYVYRVRVRTNTGESVERFEKLVILK